MNPSYFEQNKKLWNKKVEFHLQSKFYDMDAFMAGKSSLTEIEADALGDVNGKTLLHLQCHFGQDTLSWARKGAIVTRVDFSEEAIKTAKGISKELGLPARFIESNVYHLPDVLDETFDIVFTTFGAIPWLPDMEKWAAIVRRYLKKGGTFYLAEFHPALYMFNFDNYQVEYDYFNRDEPYEESVEGTYADPAAPIRETEYFWNHPFEEVIMALLNNGLQLRELREYDFSPFQCFPNMKETEPERYRWGKEGMRMPHIYSLKMEL